MGVLRRTLSKKNNDALTESVTEEKKNLFAGLSQFE